MRWKLKSKLQNLIATLPEKFSYSLYYHIQRLFGELQLKKLSPIIHLNAGVQTCKGIEKLGRSPVGGVFLEIGTGRRINIPLVFWLLGAKRVITVDLNPYLKEELVKADLNYIATHRNEVEGILEGRIYGDRLEDLMKFIGGSEYSLNDLLSFMNILYISPCDASMIDLKSESIDFHTSYTVLEHIPHNTIVKILEEGKRLLKKNGVFAHYIDYSDHFSHSDSSISPINFLRFSDEEWEKIAGNRFMYMNRLRHDDFLKIFYNLELQNLLQDIIKDEHLISSLDSVTLIPAYAKKSVDILNITSSWILAPNHNNFPNRNNL